MVQFKEGVILGALEGVDRGKFISVGDNCWSGHRKENLGEFIDIDK